MAKNLNRIKEILEEQGISQYQLHKVSGVSYALVNNYCKNVRQPSLETIFKLAKALKVNPRELINS